MEVFFIERAQVLSGRKYAEAHLIYTEEYKDVFSTKGLAERRI